MDEKEVAKSKLHSKNVLKCKNCKNYQYIGKTFKRCKVLKITITDEWFCGDFINKGNKKC